MTQKTALITGVTGQAGSYLAKLLIEKGYKVIGMKRRTSLISTDRVDSLYANPNFILEYGNMSDSHSLYKILQTHKPDEIYNLAAQSHVKVSFEVPEETCDVVGMGTLRLLNAMKEVVPEARFFQASSSEMFGDNPEYPQSELTRMTPASSYACAKLFAHNMVQHYRVAYKLHASCGIMFNMESPYRGETFVTRKITQAAAKIKLGLQDKIHLGNLEAKRDWGFVGDYVEAMWLMLQQDTPDDYVISTGETYSVATFLQTVFDYAGLDVQRHLVIDPKYFRSHEVPYLLGNSKKIHDKLGWKPKMKFIELAHFMYDTDFMAIQNKNVK